MSDDIGKEFSDIQEKISDTLSAMHTYLNRFEILINKTWEYLPPQLLEEYGEFLLDWGTCIQKFGALGEEQSKIILKLLEEIEK